MIDISVITPVYNAGELVERMLRSVLTQETQYTFEVICVDDGSTDDSIAIIEEYQMTLSNSPCSGRERVSIVLLHQQNAGPSRARNRGLELARGRYVAFIDADDYWEPTYIEKTVRFLDEHEECVACSVVCKNIAVSGESYNPSNYSPSKSPCLGRLVDSSSSPAQGRDWLGERPFVLDDFYTYWAEHCHVGTCSTTMRREVALQIKMREDLRVSEDYEFWLLLASYGMWGIIPEPLYVSDGTGLLVSQEAWIKRMKRRWENAPAISIWEKRIIERRPELKDNESYRWARGRVSRNLTYCQLLSGRYSLARKETLLYGKYFIKDPIGKLMNICKHTSLTWWMMCKFLQYRENNRFK